MILQKNKIKNCLKKKNMEQPSDLNDITVPVSICKLVDKCYDSINVIKIVMNIANICPVMELSKIIILVNKYINIRNQNFYQIFKSSIHLYLVVKHTIFFIV